MVDGLLLNIEAGKTRKQTRMYIDDPIRKRPDEFRRKQPHISGEANEFDSTMFQLRCDLCVVIRPLSAFYYYCAAVGRIEDAARASYSRLADRFWLLGCLLLLLDPSLILFTIGLVGVG